MNSDSISKQHWLRPLFFSWYGWGLIWLPVLVITLLHYQTAAIHHWFHDLLRRLYYIPIILAAFRTGLWGALTVSILISLVYIPHAFTHWFHHDPAGNLDKFLEILLYNSVGFLTGILAEREKDEKRKQTLLAQELSEMLEEKKILQQQLIRSGKLQALGTLTAGLAHEIKNPLASIKGASEIIADEIREDSPRRKMVEIQKKELHRLTTLLERFLSFARPKAFELAETDLAEMTDHVTSLLGNQANKKSITISQEEFTSFHSIKADKQSVVQVLVNIMLNAVEAIEQKGSITLSFSTENRGKRAFRIIEIADSGPGIPPKLREQIFNPFFTTKEKGTGLGLAIAAIIMDQHNGFIEVDEVNINGEGLRTLFKLYFPETSDNI